ncbi:MAG: hypothetical protein JXA58_00675 [Dehalococcoidia bacterium]|nr:hypothetical protein [Dehalococcoidia bacterium]
MAGTRKARRVAGESRESFYLRALTAAEQLDLADAGCIDGIDDEIALLRLRLRRLAEQSPERIDLQVDLAGAIARLIKTRYQISSEQKKSLKSAISRVLEEVAVPLGIGIGVGVGGTLHK